MQKRTLAPRLEALLKAGIDGEEFWDLCCDHGYLGEAALDSGRFSRVHFVDQVPHIIEKLKLRLEERGTDLSAAQFWAAPAEDFTRPLTGAVALAGVGAHSVIKILNQWERTGMLRASRLILNPHSHEGELRHFLKTWKPYREAESFTVIEKNREREILILTPR